MPLAHDVHSRTYRNLEKLSPAGESSLVASHFSVWKCFKDISAVLQFLFLFVVFVYRSPIARSILQSPGLHKTMRKEEDTFLCLVICTLPSLNSPAVGGIFSWEHAGSLFGFLSPAEVHPFSKSCDRHCVISIREITI